MDKALIEKAFEKWLDDYKSRSRCTHLDAFAGGATWQREQLINQIKEWAVNNKKDSTKIGELILDGIEFVKFLDLLEGEI